MHSMKTFKHTETGHTIVETNPNHYSIYLRMGYEEVPEKPKRKKVNK